MASVVTIYSPEGEPHKKTVANARDLANHAGWSWKPGKSATPVEPAPYARRADPKAPIKAQEVLDSVGSSGSSKLTPTEAPDEPEVLIEEVDDAQFVPVETPDDGEEPAADEDGEPADEGEEAPAAGKRTRKSKA